MYINAWDKNPCYHGTNMMAKRRTVIDMIVNCSACGTTHVVPLAKKGYMFRLFIGSGLLEYVDIIRILESQSAICLTLFNCLHLPK